MLRLAFDFIITWRETRTRPNAYSILCLLNETIACLFIWRYLFLQTHTLNINV